MNINPTQTFPFAILGILFIALKLCGIITWSWLWVLAPFWVCSAFFVIVVLVCLIFWLLFGQGSQHSLGARFR